MMARRYQQYSAKVLGSVICSTLLMTSCGSQMSSKTSQSTVRQLEAPVQNAAGLAQDAVAPTAAKVASEEAQPASPTLQNAPKNTANKPQLVKNASLSLSVNSVTDAFKATRGIVAQQQGDFLGLQDSPAPENGGRHTLAMQIRVPQSNLDATLDALSQLGTIQNRGLSAEDVSDQLVDFDARLRNLRKTESTLLTIMDRSGSIGDVLKVAQEISQVRDETERISAQVANLKNRVTFAHISLTLEQVIASQQFQRPFGYEFQEAWEQATHSMAQLTIRFGKLGIWLVAYTPYWLVLGALFLFWKQRSQRQQAIRSTVTSPSSPSITEETPPE